MALMGWLRRVSARPTVVEDEHHSVLRETTADEDALRARLAADPNDQEAFDDLVELLLARADGDERPDPLTAAHDAPVAEYHAIWALAEEVSGQPHAWLPLIVLARLSLDSDHEGAMRRLNLAAERETTGLAVAHAVAMLRDAEAYSDAVNFGVAHWALASRDIAIGREVLLASLDAGQVGEARRLLTSLTASSSSLELGDLVHLVDAAEAAHA